MASKEVVKQLRRLSKREREILQLRCDALEIAECCRQLNLSGGTVKTYIGRIYLKFDIDQLQELQRWKALFQIYCPVLKEIDLLPARDEPEDPSPIPPLLMQRVEDDEEFLYNLKKANLLSLLEEPAQPPQRSTRWLGWLVASVLLICLLLLADILIRYNALGISGIEALASTSAPSQPLIIIASAATLPTSAPVMQTVIVPQTAIVTQVVPQTVVVTQEKTVIVTATPLPVTETSASTATLETAPIAGTVLYQADWSGGLNGWPSTFGWKTLNGMLLNDGSNPEGASWKSHWVAAPFQPSETDYAVEAEIQLVGDSGCGGFGIVARGSYQSGAYGCGNQRAYISSKDNDIIKDKDFSRGTDWHTYRFEVQGNILRLKVDGSVIVEVTDNRYISSGTVGLYSDRNQVNVRSFRVIKL